MSGSWTPQDFPNLNDSNSKVTSPIKNAYNCIAWAAGDTSRWWWPIRRPGVNFWPKGVPRVETVEAFIAAYQTRGYTECADGTLEPGTEKIVIYARVERGILIPTHAARQLMSGEWTSKLGILEDISHNTTADLAGSSYGAPVCYMQRPRSTQI